jgi:hypothetical protein
MDYNYTLRYRTFDQLLEDVTIDLNTFALENMIEPQQLIKVARKLNYDLGLRINQTKETILDVCHGNVKLPDNFYTLNYVMVCGEYVKAVGYPMGGTNIQEIPYHETPSTVNTCAPITVNCRSCNANPCKHTAACDLNHPVVDPIPTEYDPNNPYGDTCVPPRVFMNCKGDKYELVQIVGTSNYNVFKSVRPLRLRQSQEIECNCPNLYFNSADEGWIKNGYLFTSFDTGKVYLNYQSSMEDENGNLLVPDHELLNDYYEYALKKRIIENLALNGEDVTQRLQLIMSEFKSARNNALSLVNTPNFKEMEKLWWTNRRSQYYKYYDMFKSYQGYSGYYGNFGRNLLF